MPNSVLSGSLIYVPIMTGGQTATGAWADVGSVFDTSRAQDVLLWLDIDINASTDFRVRALAKMEPTAAEEYFIPIKTVSPTVNKIQQEYVEFTEDIDQYVLMQVVCDKLIPYMQIQMQVGAVGAPAAILNSLYLTISRGQN